MVLYNIMIIYNIYIYDAINHVLIQICNTVDIIINII